MTDQVPRHSVSVAGVVVDGDQALLIQRRDNAHWEPPGGVLELNETITGGLAREVLEETGLVIEPVALTGVYKNMTRGIVALVFRCRPTGGTLLLNEEVKAFHWATVGEVSQMLDEAYSVRVLDAMRNTMPEIRHHDGVRLV